MADRIDAIIEHRPPRASRACPECHGTGQRPLEGAAAAEQEAWVVAALGDMHRRLHDSEAELAEAGIIEMGTEVRDATPWER